MATTNFTRLTTNEKLTWSRDLWKQADVGAFAGRYEAMVEPHGVVMVRLPPQF